MKAVDHWMNEAGKQAENVFVKEFGSSLRAMGRGVSLTFAQAARDSESLTKAASAGWDSVQEWLRSQLLF